MKRVTAIVVGRIQKVGYRARVVSIAKEFGLTGYVQNLDDGRVKIVAECEGEVPERFFDAIKIRNSPIDVSDVEVEHSGATGEYDDFYKLVKEGEMVDSLDKFIYYLKELLVVMEEGFRGVNEVLRTGTER